MCDNISQSPLIFLPWFSSSSPWLCSLYCCLPLPPTPQQQATSLFAYRYLICQKLPFFVNLWVSIPYGSDNNDPSFYMYSFHEGGHYQACSSKGSIWCKNLPICSLKITKKFCIQILSFGRGKKNSHSSHTIGWIKQFFCTMLLNLRVYL
jgi:hypothetical protein